TANSGRERLSAAVGGWLGRLSPDLPRLRKPGPFTGGPRHVVPRSSSSCEQHSALTDTQALARLALEVVSDGTVVENRRTAGHRGRVAPPPGPGALRARGGEDRSDVPGRIPARQDRSPYRPPIGRLVGGPAGNGRSRFW